MNQRIKQLAEQADDYADTYCDTIALSYSNWNTIRDEKFAELIVKECTNAVYEHGLTYDDVSAGKIQAGWFADAIKQRFGVKK